MIMINDEDNKRTDGRRGARRNDYPMGFYRLTCNVTARCVGLLSNVRRDREWHTKNDLRAGGTPATSGLPAGDYETRTDDHQNDAHGRRKLFVVMSRNPDVHVARANAVVFGMWKWHEKGKDAQHQHEYTDDQQHFHGLPPRIGFDAPLRCAAAARAVAALLGRNRGQKGCRENAGPEDFTKRSPSQTRPGSGAQCLMDLSRSRASGLPSTQSRRCPDGSTECLRQIPSRTLRR